MHNWRGSRRTGKGETIFGWVIGWCASALTEDEDETEAGLGDRLQDPVQRRGDGHDVEQDQREKLRLEEARHQAQHPEHVVAEGRARDQHVKEHAKNPLSLLHASGRHHNGCSCCHERMGDVNQQKQSQVAKPQRLRIEKVDYHKRDVKKEDEEDAVKLCEVKVAARVCLGLLVREVAHVLLEHDRHFRPGEVKHDQKVANKVGAPKCDDQDEASKFFAGECVLRSLEPAHILKEDKSRLANRSRAQQYVDIQKHHERVLEK
mmetsp:Transcript_17421/g.40079  ORF Transcript_17421/g.40079 Transcript_17421/m.40079 type:complete len:262 (-) Transcript_17421:1072-1857(-)